MRSNRLAWWMVGIVLACGRVAPAADAVYRLVPGPHGFQVEDPQGKPVFGYITSKASDSALTANSVCCFHPVFTPSGEVVTAFAPKDHPHHRGIFLAWFAMQGATSGDFWGWGKYAPTEGRVIVPREARLVATDAEHAELQIHNDWMAENERMLREDLQVMVRHQTSANVLDLSYRLTPELDLRLDQTAYSGFCARGREGAGTIEDPQGKVTLDSPHYLKPETNWPAQPWYALSWELSEGKAVGMAVLPHPGNPPATWHNLTSLGMLNPCLTAPGPVELKKGEPLELRYRIVAYDGPPPRDVLNALAEEWRRR